MTKTHTCEQHLSQIPWANSYPDKHLGFSYRVWKQTIRSHGEMRSTMRSLFSPLWYQTIVKPIFGVDLQTFLITLPWRVHQGSGSLKLSYWSIQSRHCGLFMLPLWDKTNPKCYDAGTSLCSFRQSVTGTSAESSMKCPTYWWNSNSKWVCTEDFWSLMYASNMVQQGGTCFIHEPETIIDINKIQWYFIVSTVTVRVKWLLTTETFRKVRLCLTWTVSSISQTDTQDLVFKKYDFSLCSSKDVPSLVFFFGHIRKALLLGITSDHICCKTVSLHSVWGTHIRVNVINQGCQDWAKSPAELDLKNHTKDLKLEPKIWALENGNTFFLFSLSLCRDLDEIIMVHMHFWYIIHSEISLFLS